MDQAGLPGLVRHVPWTRNDDCIDDPVVLAHALADLRVVFRVAGVVRHEHQQPIVGAWRREVVGVVLRDLVHRLFQGAPRSSELRLDEEPERRDAEVDPRLDRTDRRRVLLALQVRKVEAVVAKRGFAIVASAG